MWVILTALNHTFAGVFNNSEGREKNLFTMKVDGEQELVEIKTD